jgi:hypothetical protein
MSSNLSRRTLLTGAASSALVAGVAMPAVIRAQADAIRIGHLTPLTGFLGPLGEYAVMGVQRTSSCVRGDPRWRRTTVVAQVRCATNSFGYAAGARE